MYDARRVTHITWMEVHMKKVEPVRKYNLTINDLIIAFASPRTDHPGRKAGCPWRRGSYGNKIRVKR